MHFILKLQILHLPISKKGKKMKEYYNRYWMNKIDGGVMDKPPSSEDVSTFKIQLNKIRKYLSGKCLDVGCGNGLLTSQLNKITPTIGLDISEIAIKKARKKYPKIKFVKGYVTELPFKKNQFDCIFASELVEHIQDTEAMFYEFKRVLKKRGYLIIKTPQLTMLKNLYIALFYWDKYYHPFNPHIRFYSKRSLIKILKTFGFEVIQYESDGKFFGLVPKGMIIVAKKI